MSSTKGTNITRTPFALLPTMYMVDGVAFRYPIALLPHMHDGIMVFVHPHLAVNPERITAWTGQSKRQSVETALNELARSLQYNELDAIHGGMDDEQALVEPNHPTSPAPCPTPPSLWSTSTCTSTALNCGN